jgi:tripartite-type tricarboxylate transporter receptor subunit TctC
MTIRGNVSAGAVVAALVLCTSLAAAQPYPSKPIRLIVPFAPGGGTDIVARIMAQRATDALKQSVVVDNRGGAGGLVGMEMIVRATPDGYTLGIVTASIGTTAATYKLPYDPVTDMAPINIIGETGYLLTLHPSVPVRTTQELIAYARAHPGKVNYGSSGTGGTAHLAGELFDLMARVKTTHVPYKSSGPALVDLLAGQIEMIYGSVPVIVPHTKTGKLRVLSITTVKRSHALPDIPTVAESGVPGYETITWYGLVGPKRLPRDIATRWQDTLATALQTREMRERFQLDGLETGEAGSAYLAGIIKRDIEKWARVVKAANLKLQ